MARAGPFPRGELQPCWVKPSWLLGHAWKLGMGRGGMPSHGRLCTGVGVSGGTALPLRLARHRARRSHHQTQEWILSVREDRP